MITAGIDVGTRFVKVCLTDGNIILGSSFNEIKRDIEKVVKDTFADALKSGGIKKREVKKTISTGYGAHLVRMAEYPIHDPACIARAAHTLNPTIKTVIDIGALFIRIISINENGFSDAHYENDLCAAGSGKFLEVIANVLEIPFSQISEYCLKAENPYVISSSCAVFAESEIISQINSGANSSDIIAGVVESIVHKATSLLGKSGILEKISLTGGVAKIPAFANALKKSTGKEIVFLPIDPQMMSAYGAALLAQGNTPTRRLLKSG
jgi:predicted CoA-substrate-specific enzyme activase